MHVLQLTSRYPDIRLLVTAPSDAAADVLLYRWRRNWTVWLTEELGSISHESCACIAASQSGILAMCAPPPVSRTYYLSAHWHSLISLFFMRHPGWWPTTLPWNFFASTGGREWWATSVYPTNNYNYFSVWSFPWLYFRGVVNYEILRCRLYIMREFVVLLYSPYSLRRPTPARTHTAARWTAYLTFRARRLEFE